MNLKVALILAALAATPLAAAADSNPHAQNVVAGHTVFAELTPDGSSFAAIAGSVQCQVLWFNDQVLFRVPAGTTGMCGDARFVYAYPAGAPDPRGNPTLAPTGRAWDFTDPNGAGWHVAEYQYRQLDITLHQDLGLPDYIGSDLRADQTNHTAWVVEAGQPIRDPTILRDYNFVVLVDTAKLVVAEDNTVLPDPQAAVPLNATSAAGVPAQPRAPDGVAPAGSGSYVTLSLGDAPAGWS
ncbi:MAG: hypothetical protein LC624_07140 [Halobacteriales archaeon]|nr:hypothetical protein [Halobacteriales archaeon]